MNVSSSYIVVLMVLTMNTILRNVVGVCLTLFIGASVQGSYTYTTLEVPGTLATSATGIDGG